MSGGQKQINILPVVVAGSRVSAGVSGPDHRGQNPVDDFSNTTYLSSSPGPPWFLPNGLKWLPALEHPEQVK